MHQLAWGEMEKTHSNGVVSSQELAPAVIHVGLSVLLLQQWGAAGSFPFEETLRCWTLEGGQWFTVSLFAPEPDCLCYLLTEWDASLGLRWEFSSDSFSSSAFCAFSLSLFLSS